MGKITDEGIAKLRERVGKGFAGRRPWRTEVTRDAIYHLAYAIGDLNPLYLDEDYAKKSRWGTLLAPPIIVQTMDTLRAVGHSGLPEGLPGVHSIWTGSYYEWKRPPMLGDRIRADSYLKEIREKESTFGGGRAALSDLRGEVLRPERRAHRRPQRHLDPHRARQDPREEEVRRHPAGTVDPGGHRPVHGGIPQRPTDRGALLGGRQGRRLRSARSSRAR